MFLKIVTLAEGVSVGLFLAVVSCCKTNINVLKNNPKNNAKNLRCCRY